MGLARINIFLCLSILFNGLCAEAQKISNDSLSVPTLKARIITRVDLMGGVNLILPNGTESFNNIRTPKWGVLGGIGLQHAFSPRLQVGLKILYEDKGYKLETNSKNDDYTPPADQKGIINITFNYVTASLLMRYTIDKRNRFYVGAGPYYGYLFSEKILTELYINGSLVNKSTYKGQSPYSDYEKHDIGITALVGYDIKLKSRLGCNVELLCNPGLVNVALPPIASMKNMTYAVHFSFYLKNSSSITHN